MSLTLESLQGMGAFTAQPVEKAITWQHNGQDFEASVFIRPLSYQAAVSDMLNHQNPEAAVAGRIAASVCDETGKPILTAADIQGTAVEGRGALNANLTLALLNAIHEVNTAGKP